MSSGILAKGPALAQSFGFGASARMLLLIFMTEARNDEAQAFSGLDLALTCQQH